MTRKRTHWITSLATATAVGALAMPGLAEEFDPEVEAMRMRVESIEQQLEEMETAEVSEPAVEAAPPRPHPHSRHDRLDPFTPRGFRVGAMEDVEFRLGVHTVGRAHWFEQSSVRVWDGSDFERPSDIGPGIQTGWANIDFQLFIGEDIEIFFDGLFATQRHPTRFWGHQGYIYIRQLPEDTFLAPANMLLDHVDIKVGNFYPDFGNEVHRRSLNADVQRNPLIGNPVVSPHGVEPGVEIIYEREINGHEFGMMVGGGIGAPEEDFNADRDFSFRSKLWFEPIDTMQIAGSFYHVDHGDEVDRGTNLFRRERLGSAYSSVWNFGDDDSGSGEGAGQVRIGDGRRLTAAQADLNWDITDQLFFNTHGGVANASGGDPTDAMGNERWVYYGADLTYYLTDDLYIAGRYSEANSRKFLTSDNTGRVGRAQAGFGIWITDNILAKTEYVWQQAWGFNDGTRGVAGNVDVGRNPTFHGGVAEVSISF